MFDFLVAEFSLYASKNSAFKDRELVVHRRGCNVAMAPKNTERSAAFDTSSPESARPFHVAVRNGPRSFRTHLSLLSRSATFYKQALCEWPCFSQETRVLPFMCAVLQPPTCLQGYMFMLMRSSFSHFRNGTSVTRLGWRKYQVNHTSALALASAVENPAVTSLPSKLRFVLLHAPKHRPRHRVPRHICRRSRSSPSLSHGLTRLSASPSVKKSGARYHRNIPSACPRHHIISEPIFTNFEVLNQQVFRDAISNTTSTYTRRRVLSQPQKVFSILI